MDESFSWKSFDRVAKILESLGYIVAVFGPLTGIGMLILGDIAVKFMGIVTILASCLVALYHISFSLLMGAVKGLQPVPPAAVENADVN